MNQQAAKPAEVKAAPAKVELPIPSTTIKHAERAKPEEAKTGSPAKLELPIPPITIKHAERLAAIMAAAITLLLQEYEAITGLHVHSIPVEHGKAVSARVKVQLPEMG